MDNSKKEVYCSSWVYSSVASKVRRYESDAKCFILCLFEFMASKVASYPSNICRENLWLRLWLSSSFSALVIPKPSSVLSAWIWGGHMYVHNHNSCYIQTWTARQRKWNFRTIETQSFVQGGARTAVAHLKKMPSKKRISMLKLLCMSIFNRRGIIFL